MTSYDELAGRLRLLRAWSGTPYREVHRRIVKTRRTRGIAELPAYDTVHRCFQAGRCRLDADLVGDIAQVLLADEVLAAEWRQACQQIEERSGDAAIVSTAGSLPADLADFTGRQRELGDLLAAVDAGERTVVVEGMAGVGKSRLAIRAAHRLVAAGRFADVQLAVDLRGFDAERPPADPTAVLDGFLRRLGTPGKEVQRLSLGRRADRLSEALAGRHALILLDNAASGEQVRSLLPASPTCLVLITSRRRLTELTTAWHQRLGVFSSAEAVDLLRRGASHEVVADPATATGIAEVVGHLPLALAMVASRIRAYPDWTLADHLERLLEHRDTLRLEDGVEVALRSSYQDLPAEQRRMFRALALHPGRDFDDRSAAALAGTGLAEARRTLAGLLARNMLQQRRSGRYCWHDLVRIFAVQCARDQDPAAARRTAAVRLFRHYRCGAARAMERYAPQDADRRPRVEPSGTPIPEFADQATAAAWLDRERSNLVVTAMRATDSGAGEFATDLSVIMFRYLDTRAHYRDAVILHRVAAAASTGIDRGRVLTNLGVALQRLGRYDEALDHYRSALAIHTEHGNRAGAGSAHGNLGVACALLGRYPDALEHLGRAVVIHRDSGNRTGLATANGNLGGVLERLGRYDEAAAHQRRYLEISREIGYRAGEGKALGNLGRVFRRQGQFGHALELHQQALALARDTGYREGEAEILNDTAVTLRCLGRPADAAERHRAALAIAVDVGSQYERARAHEGLGRCADELDEHGSAVRHWRRALALHTDLGTPEAAEISLRLSHFPPGSGSNVASVQLLDGSKNGKPSVG